MVKSKQESLQSEMHPCPFCGNQDTHVRWCDDDGVGDWAAVGCLNCGAEGPASNSLQEAVEKWNKREGEE